MSNSDGNHSSNSSSSTSSSFSSSSSDSRARARVVGLIGRNRQLIHQLVSLYQEFQELSNAVNSIRGRGGVLRGRSVCQGSGFIIPIQNRSNVSSRSTLYSHPFSSSSYNPGANNNSDSTNHQSQNQSNI